MRALTARTYGGPEVLALEEMPVPTPADGELLVVPQAGGLALRTELGLITVKPGEICVIPRGLKFKAAAAGRAKQ